MCVIDVNQQIITVTMAFDFVGISQWLSNRLVQISVVKFNKGFSNQFVNAQ